jgi:translation initiation factor IF-3
VPVPRRFDRRPPERDTTRINERIRVPKVRLIGADGEQLGVVEINEALKRAQEADLDLVEVAPNSKPPVTRLLDYSKYKYEQEQKQKQARKHQQQVNIREIKLRPKIADHDYETKKGHVERFLRHQDKVKVTIMFRGREQAHPERGRALLQRLYEDLDGLAVIESQPLQEGRNMSMLLAPGKEAAKVDAETAPSGAQAPAAPEKPVAATPTAEEAKVEDEPAAPAEPAVEEPAAEDDSATADESAGAEPAEDQASEESPGDDAAAA